ncbi:MAG TPA: tetratricopeptide repeat protein, partial [Rhodanobacter sp.]|nr:tetratricopeptide repeat protein [Rhodanobacter sp.]
MNETATGFLARLKQRKLVQWALAYIAFAFALLQGVDIVAQRFAWPDQLERILILALAVGFFVALVLAWYHGERGAQKVSSTEIVILALLLAIGGGLLWRFERATPATSPETAQRNPGTSAVTQAVPIPAKSIAVLPFENLSQDKDNAYFADGMQDLILTKLADIGDLKVISRTSTMKYKARPDNLKQVAAELGVATILEGSVQKSGNQVLVNVQLINAATDAHLWAQSYTRTLDNVFGVEGEVADKIAAALSAKLSPAQAKQLAAAPTTNPAAYDTFLRAEYQSNQGDVNNSRASWKAAIALYRQAVTLDPKFALAWARLSMAESKLAFFGGGGQDVAQLKQKARVDAEQALTLQPGLPTAQLALGYCDYWGQRDYAGALKAFAAVLVLRPNDAEALAAQGYVQRRQGRFDDAIASLTKAAALDPRNFQLTYELGGTNMMTGRYPEAEQWLQRALALEPDSISAKGKYSNAILFGSGDIPRALAAAQGDDPVLKSQRASLLSFQRKFPEAIALFESI